jgi:hypothetical protein
MSYRTVYKEVEVDVDMSDFDDEELIEELESRGRNIGGLTDSADLVNAIWFKRRMGQNFDRELDQLIYNATGRII